MSFMKRFLEGLSVFKVSKKAILKVFSLALIFIVGFLLRAFPVFKSGYNIRAYDPYMQFYTAQYIEEHGLKAFFSLFDTQSWAPFGRNLGTFYIGVAAPGAFLHSFLTLVGFNVSFMSVVALIPSLFGALSSLVVYGIVHDLVNDRAALFSAFISAISMGMIRRSVVGFFDNDAVGIFFLLVSLWMFFRGMKKESVFPAFLSGIFLAFLSWTWGANKYLFGLYALFALLLVVTGKLDTGTAITYSVTILVAVGLKLLLPANYNTFTDPVTLGSLAMVGLIAIYFGSVFLSDYTTIDQQSLYGWLVGGILLIGIVSAVALSLGGYIGGIGGKYLSILNPTIRENLPAFSSVSENQPATWSSIFQGVFLPIIFAPLGIYYFIEERSKEGGFFILCMINAFYFSSSISRLVVLFSPFFAMAAGIGIVYLLDPLAAVLKKEWILHKVRPVRRRLGEMTLPRGEAVVGYVLVGLVLFLTMYHTRQNVKNYERYDLSNGEQKVFQYLRTHASPADRVAAWWDYGYRLRYSAHVTTIVDNLTHNYHSMGTVGAMLMLPPGKSIDIMRKYKVKYVVVYKVDLKKAQWMIKISSKHASEWGVVKDEWYNSESQKYKKPFFQSTLWKLVGAQMTGEERLAKRLAVDKLQDQLSGFKVSGTNQLDFFKTLETGSNIYLYKVLYRTAVEDLPPVSV